MSENTEVPKLEFEPKPAWISGPLRWRERCVVQAEAAECGQKCRHRGALFTKEIEGGSFGSGVVQCIPGKTMMRAGWTGRQKPVVMGILILSWREWGGSWSIFCRKVKWEYLHLRKINLEKMENVLKECKARLEVGRLRKYFNRPGQKWWAPR